MHVCRNFSIINSFSSKNIVFFYHFWQFMQVCVLPEVVFHQRCQNCYLSVHKILLRKNFFLKIITFLTIPDIERGKIGLLPKLFRQTCQNCIKILQGIIPGNVSENTWFWSFSDFARKFSEVSSNVFQQVCQNFWQAGSTYP